MSIKNPTVAELMYLQAINKSTIYIDKLTEDYLDLFLMPVDESISLFDLEIIIIRKSYEKHIRKKSTISSILTSTTKQSKIYPGGTNSLGLS